MTDTEQSDYIVTTVRNCARCKGTHKDLRFKRLSHPLEFDKSFTHWAHCPSNHEPVLLSTDES